MKEGGGAGGGSPGALSDLARELHRYRAEQTGYEDRLFSALCGQRGGSVPTGLQLSTVVQGSHTWHEARKQRVTASEFGAIAGLSPYVDRAALWQLKSGRLAREEQGNEDTARGVRLERTAVDWYRRTMWDTESELRETGLWVSSLDEPRARPALPISFPVGSPSLAHIADPTRLSRPRLQVHPSCPFLAASPDQLVGAEGLLEVKCPRHGPHQRVPAHYLAQVVGQLQCTSRKWCDFISFTEASVSVFRVERSDRFWAWLYPQLEAFYVALETDEPPPAVRYNPNLQALAESLCDVQRLW